MGNGVLSGSPNRLTKSGDCLLVVIVTGVLLALVMVLELTGPPRSLLFSIRLPALVLAFGVGWAASRRRWGAYGGGPPVPMATPCLVMSSMLGSAALTAKLASVSPLLAGAVLLTVAACCCMAAGVLIAGGRRSGAAREDSTVRDAAALSPESGEFLASRIPRQTVRPVAVDA